MATIFVKWVSVTANFAVAATANWFLSCSSIIGKILTSHSLGLLFKTDLSF